MDASVQNSLDNRKIAGTPAKIAGEDIPDPLSIYIGFFGEQCMGRRDESWGTETALKCVMLAKCRLQR